MVKDYFYIMKNTFKKKSLNRILQEIYLKEKTADGKIIEFGSELGFFKNFINQITIFLKVKKNNVWN